jgi:hypothetical protein
MSEEGKTEESKTEEGRPASPTVVVTRPENAAEYAGRRHREVKERERAQAELTRQAFLGTREEPTGFRGDGSVLDGLEGTEDAISVLTSGKRLPPKKEGA